MKIAQVSPLYERVPPVQYGGTERIVSYLTEALVKQGHEVTLFASGDSITRAKLISPCPQSLRLDPNVVDSLPHHIAMLEQVFRRIEEFDIVHFHIDYLHFPLSRRHCPMNLTTLHGRLDYADLVPLYKEYSDMPVASISNAQRSPLPWLNWQGTVYHGLPDDLYAQGEGKGRYLAFLGRISPEKGVERAIEISARTGIPLKIAAKVDRADQAYFQEVIDPLLKRSPLTDFVGEITDAQKNDFLGSALALLFPIDWPEPFGLVMIESMACGTPVIAFRRGSVPEVMKPGVTGYIVESVPEAVEAVEKVLKITRARCRETFELCYSASRMAADYVTMYEQILEAGSHKENVGRIRGRYYPAEGPVLCPGDLIAS